MSNDFSDRPGDDSLEMRLSKSPFRDFVTEYLLEEIRAIQTEMADAASHFSKTELEALRAIIGLTVEFFYYLKRTDMDSVDSYGVQYVNESTFSGLDFFTAVCHVYEITEGHISSRLPRNVASLTALKDKFIAMYQVFLEGAAFEKNPFHDGPDLSVRHTHFMWTLLPRSTIGP